MAWSNILLLSIILNITEFLKVFLELVNHADMFLKERSSKEETFLLGYWHGTLTLS